MTARELPLPVEGYLVYYTVNKTMVIWRNTEVLLLHTDEPTVHWEYNISFIYVVEAKTVNPIAKHIDIPV